MNNKTERWVHSRQILAVSGAAAPQDGFQELVTQVGGAYVRLTDAELIQIAELAFSGTRAQGDFARQQLAANAGPVALEAAYHAAPRFGGVYEAFDAALHLLNRLLPRTEVLANGKSRKSGWNPFGAGIRWLTWVELKLPAELPGAAERLVDEKRESGAGAAIAAGRSRLLRGAGNDAPLYADVYTRPVGKVGLSARLPTGRKNVVVKRGKGRVTAAFLLSARLGCVRSAAPSKTLPVMQAAHLPLNADWVARAVRANARDVLARPNLGAATQRNAEALSRVGPNWVNLNSKAHRLDAPVGEEGEARLSDILTAEAVEPGRFEAPLHRADAVRALGAFRKYGPVYGDALVKLPVRELLPVQAKRLRERQVRTAFAGLLTRAGIPAQGEQAIQAARLAARLCGLDLSASPATLRAGLAGVQSGLRRPAAPTGAFGAALAGALAGTPLAPASAGDLRIVSALGAAFPALPMRFPLAAMIVYARKLDAQGDSDRRFVDACRKADVRVRVAEDALALLGELPVTERRSATRIRVQGPKGYLRPWQLALESLAHSVGARADHARPRALELQRQLAEAEQDAEDAITDAAWLAALDRAADLRAGLALSNSVSVRLNTAVTDIEQSAGDLNLARALSALLSADDAAADQDALDNAGAWWADASRALNINRPVAVA